MVSGESREPALFPRTMGEFEVQKSLREETRLEQRNNVLETGYVINRLAVTDKKEPHRQNLKLACRSSQVCGNLGPDTSYPSLVEVAGLQKRKPKFDYEGRKAPPGC